MDAYGARLLAARIRAGVRIGTRIELVTGGAADSGVQAGDCGVVLEITEEGCVVVGFDRGFSLEIDPELTPYRRLAA